MWVLAEADGTIITAHCTCMAGLGEACSHIGATLFAVETAVRIRDARTCTEKTNMWLPAHNSRAQYKRLKDIDFSSSQRKKKQMESMDPDSNAVDTNRTEARLPVPPPPTEEEQKQFYANVAQSGIRPALFMVTPEYSALFQPPRQREPQLLRNLACAEACSEDLPALITRAEKFLAELTVNEEMVEHVEGITRNQAKCQKWYAYRAGRITASNMKNVCTTTVSKPSLSLLKKICYPEEHQFSSSATAWGLQHESDALHSYEQEMMNRHVNFTHHRTGVYLSSEHPYLAASPDASVECACCGRGTVEVKCPYTLATKEIQSALDTNNFCLEHTNGTLHLKQTHAYYFQVQTQMAVCHVAYCDFVVWTPQSLHIERVKRDDAFFEKVLPCAREFFTHVVVPELFAQYFTRTNMVSTSSNDKNSFCYCQGPEAGKMLACDGPGCKYQWFHYTCLGIRRAPKQKVWLCQECATSASSQGQDQTEATASVG